MHFLKSFCKTSKLKLSIPLKNTKYNTFSKISTCSIVY